MMASKLTCSRIIKVESLLLKFRVMGSSKITPSGKRNVKIEHIEPVGNYAIRPSLMTVMTRVFSAGQLFMITQLDKMP